MVEAGAFVIVPSGGGAGVVEGCGLATKPVTDEPLAIVPSGLWISVALVAVPSELMTGGVIVV